MRVVLSTCALLWAASTAFGQGAPCNEVLMPSLLYAMQGDTVWTTTGNARVCIDPPLTFTKGADGRMHLGVNSAGLTVLDQNGNPVGTTSTLKFADGGYIQFVLSAVPGAILVQPALNTAAIPFFVDPPAGPGQCVPPVSPNTPSGSRPLALDDAGYLYTCKRDLTPLWTVGTAYATGAVVLTGGPSVTQPWVLTATVAGTSDPANMPVCPSAGATVIDGTVTWSCTAVSTGFVWARSPAPWQTTW